MNRLPYRAILSLFAKTGLSSQVMFAMQSINDGFMNAQISTQLKTFTGMLSLFTIMNSLSMANLRLPMEVWLLRLRYHSGNVKCKALF